MKNTPDAVLKAFNVMYTPALLRRYTFEAAGARGIRIQPYDWVDKDLFGGAQAQIEFIKTISANILSDDVTAELIRSLQGDTGILNDVTGELSSAIQGVIDDPSSVGFVHGFNMIFNSVATTFTVTTRIDNLVVFTHTVDHLKDETENKTPYPPPANHGKIVDHVAGVLTYCAFRKYCENMYGSDIKSHLIELVGPDIVEEAVKKVISL